MKILTTIHELQDLRQQLTAEIGFVATMGCLHPGHASLIRQAREENELTVLSIFVNPTQFNNAADLENYPITIDEDVQLAELMGVDVIFMPDYKSLYPRNYSFKLTTNDPLALQFEGEMRPGHYDGVLTVVMKLLNLIRPTRAYFGEKDFQQVTLIKRMVECFFMQIEIIMCPVIRESSGLALSSRNTRLNDEQKQRATYFAQTLQKHSDNIDEIKQQLAQHNIKIDYIERYQQRLLAAVYIDDIRLIDTIE